MKYLVCGLLILFSSGCVSVDSDMPVQPQSGCFRKPISKPIPFSGFDLGETDIFVIRFPYGDGAVGPIKSIHFDRSPTGGLEPSGNPRIIYTVGDSKLSCSVVLSESQCPQAKDAYAKLMAQSLPLNFAENVRDIIPVGTSYTYELLAKDGKHNMLQWKGHSPRHPFFGVVESTFSSVAQCGASADTLFSSKVF